MSCEEFTKDPLDKRRLNIDFATWLGTTSEISAVAWTVPSGLTEASSSFSTTVATNYLSGGTDGQDYEVICVITTNDSVPREKTQRVLVQVIDNCG